MARKDLPLKYILRRLFELGQPYLKYVLFGALFMVCMNACMGMSLTLIRPLFNMATSAKEAGLNTANHVKEAATYIDNIGIPLSSWSDSIMTLVPDFMELSQTETYKNKLLVFIVCASIGLSLAIMIFQYLAYYYSHKVSLSALTDVRAQLNKVLIHQNLAYYDKYKPGELMSRVQNDTEIMSRALIFVFNQAPRGAITILTGLIMAAWQSPKLMIGILILPIFILPIKKLGKKIKRSSKATLEKRAELSDAMHQQFGGIQEIKGFNQEENRQNIFTKANNSVLKGLMNIVKARAKSRAIVEGGGYMAIILLVTGIILVIGQNNSGESFSSFASFMALITFLVWTPLRTLSKAYNEFQNSLPGVHNILEIIDHPEPTVESESPTPFPKNVETIRFDRVSYQYPQGPLVLNKIEIEARRGQVVALVGHTGSGKSTSVTLLPRFRDPIEGQILINGSNIKDFKLNKLRDNIAFVNQDPYLFNTSIKDNLLMGHETATEDDLWSALEKAQLAEFVREKEERLNYNVGERGNNLSGGQKQRLAIARAILKNAPILVLDEATSSQDNVTEKQIQEALSILMEGRTTFVIAHRLSTIVNADTILVFKEGEIVESGSHEELKEQGGEYASLYQSQFEH